EEKYGHRGHCFEEDSTIRGEDSLTEITAVATIDDDTRRPGEVCSFSSLMLGKAEYNEVFAPCA
ncbi:MAG: hypothetical protein ACKOE4_03935, partial [Candidatus Kapaibacterium sp.]